jgi:hypothetical protein
MLPRPWVSRTRLPDARPRRWLPDPVRWPVGRSLGLDQALGGGVAPRLDQELGELDRVDGRQLDAGPAVPADGGRDAEGLRGGGDRGGLLLRVALTVACRPSSESVANIRNVGCPQVSRSSASGGDSTTRRSSSAVFVPSRDRLLEVDRRLAARQL